jgi:hypothetical protein
MAFEVDGGSGIEHQAFDAKLGEYVGGHASGGAGSNDEDVVVGFHAVIYSIVK